MNLAVSIVVLSGCTQGIGNDISDMLHLLRSDLIADRERAASLLVNKGLSVRGALREALSSADDEYASRIRSVLDELSSTPDGFCEILRDIGGDTNRPCRLLIESANALTRILRARHWGNLLQAAQALGLQCVEEWRGRRAAVYRFLLRPGRLVLSINCAMDLLIEVSVADPVDGEGENLESVRVILATSLSKNAKGYRVSDLARVPELCDLHDLIDGGVVKGENGKYPFILSLELGVNAFSRARNISEKESDLRVRVEMGDNAESPFARSIQEIQKRANPIVVGNGCLTVGSHSRPWSNAEITQSVGEIRRKGGSVDQFVQAGSKPSTSVPRRCSTPADLRSLPASVLAIEIVGDSFSDDDCQGFNRFLHLRRLAISGAAISSRGLLLLRSLPFLEELRIGSLKGEFTAVGDVGSWGKLVSLDIKFADRVTDVTFESIARLPRLEELELFCATELSERDIDQLNKSKSLRRVSLSIAAGASGSGMRRLGSLRGLRRLNLLEGRDVGVEALDEVRAFKSLEVLQLSKVRVLPGFFRAIARSETLRHVQVYEVIEASDESLAGIESICEVGSILRLELPSELFRSKPLQLIMERYKARYSVDGVR